MTADRSGPLRDLWAFAGLTVIAVCAAVMSFAAWSGLAVQVGMDQRLGPVRLGWLLPLSIDAYAMVATRVWLMDRSVSDRTKAYARWTAVAAIVLSFAGNALFHLVGVLDLQASGSWWLYVVLVSGLPAAQFGQAVHLIVRMRSDQQQATVTDRTSRADGPPTSNPAVSLEVGPDSATNVGPAVQSDDGLMESNRHDAPVLPVRSQPRRSPSGRRGVRLQTIRDHMDQHPDWHLTKAAVMVLLGLNGSGTAQSLVTQIKSERSTPAAGSDDPDREHPAA